MSEFFMVTTAVPLLVLILGLELHTATDRLIARGLSPRVALAWLWKREALCSLGVFAALMVGVYGFDLAPVIPMGILANAVVGLGVQEIFRALIMVGAQAAANGVLFVRNTVPFVLSAVFAVAGSFRVEFLLGVWLVGGVLAGAVGLAALVKLGQWSPKRNAVPKRLAWRHIRAFFPSTVIARGLLSADVVLVGTFHQPMVGIYGNCNAAISAFFALADVGIIQWRMKSVLQDNDDRALRKFQMELTTMAIASFGAVVLLGVAIALLKSQIALMTALPLVLVMGMAGAFIVFAQGGHVNAYARGEDSRIRRSYLLAGILFLCALCVCYWSQQPLFAALGKAGAWLVVIMLLPGHYGDLTRNRKCNCA